MIIILDLDETLVHTSESVIPNLSYFKYDDLFVHKRPHLDFFIKKLMNDDYYDFAVWSAGKYGYVHHIVNKIFPRTADIAFVMTRDDCNEKRDKPLYKARNLYNQLYCGNQLIQTKKDPLPVYIEPKTVHDFIIIDDREAVTSYDQLNHLQIPPFEGDSDDSELQILWEYLESNKGKPSEWLSANWQ